MDYAHSIALGYANERYYLLFVAGDTNFMWAAPMETRMELEKLLLDFITLSGFRIGKIRVDGEFDTSSAFKAFSTRKNMVLCPSVAYTHTMQARAEGAVHTCKEHWHVRCLLKASNTPALFFCTLTFFQSLQLLAGSFDTATLGGDEGLQVQLQLGEGSSSLGLLHGGEAAKGTS
eukprot:641074-Rhodomonas_salina.1